MAVASSTHFHRRKGSPRALMGSLALALGMGLSSMAFAQQQEETSLPNPAVSIPVMASADAGGDAAKGPVGWVGAFAHTNPHNTTICDQRTDTAYPPYWQHVHSAVTHIGGEAPTTEGTVIHVCRVNEAAATALSQTVFKDPAAPASPFYYVAQVDTRRDGRPAAAVVSQGIATTIAGRQPGIMEPGALFVDDQGAVMPTAGARPLPQAPSGADVRAVLIQSTRHQPTPDADWGYFGTLGPIETAPPVSEEPAAPPPAGQAQQALSQTVLPNSGMVQPVVVAPAPSATVAPPPSTDWVARQVKNGTIYASLKPGSRGHRMNNVVIKPNGEMQADVTAIYKGERMTAHVAVMGNAVTVTALKGGDQAKFRKLFTERLASEVKRTRDEVIAQADAGANPKRRLPDINQPNLRYAYAPVDDCCDSRGQDRKMARVSLITDELRPDRDQEPSMAGAGLLAMPLAYAAMARAGRRRFDAAKRALLSGAAWRAVKTAIPSMVAGAVISGAARAAVYQSAMLGLKFCCAAAAVTVPVWAVAATTVGAAALVGGGLHVWRTARRVGPDRELAIDNAENFWKGAFFGALGAAVGAVAGPLAGDIVENVGLSKGFEHAVSWVSATATDITSKATHAVSIATPSYPVQGGRSPLLVRPVMV